jgi:uncharacterized protein (DUF1778 family)
MDVDLRIPVTADQKALVVKAASLEQSEVAGWIRQIILKAAAARIEQQSDRKGKRRGSS